MSKQKTVAKKYLEELAASVSWGPTPAEVRKLIKAVRKDAPALRGKNPVEVLVGHMDQMILGADGQAKQKLQGFRDALAVFDPEKFLEILEYLDRCDGLNTDHYRPQEESVDDEEESW